MQGLCQLPLRAENPDKNIKINHLNSNVTGMR
ncbi:hypothetical protein PANA5342_3317 [Pantoea ananatis LMG 5342]|nr:hypothetical protein PANA5342_3317 [Pantoea ananatis LMG 5342]